MNTLVAFWTRMARKPRPRQPRELVLLIGGLLKHSEKVANREGVSPEITTWILRSRREPVSFCEFGHEPNRIAL